VESTKFTRLAPADFELLGNLVGSKILRRYTSYTSYTSFPAAIPSISRDIGSNIAILGHSRLAQRVQYFLPNF